MDMPRNTFKQAIAESRMQIGLFLGLASPLSAELLATCGFDYLLIDAEHGPNDLRSVQAQLQAIAAYPVQTIVRPPNPDPSLIKQLLGVGVQTLLIPMVETAEQAEKLVAAMHYPPAGIRGVGTGLERGARWNAVPDYFAEANKEMCLLVQIESLAALDNLDAILNVKGVDGVFIGPSDLSASMGYLGQPGHPDVKLAIGKALAKIRSAGKAAGIFSADAKQVKTYCEQGASFVALGADTALLRNAAIALLGAIKPELQVAKGAAY